MHDLHAANSLLKLVLEKAAENKLSRVDRIVIELGSIVEHGQEILPENLKFNLKMLSRNTAAAKAEIVIKKAGTDNWKLVEIEGD